VAVDPASAPEDPLDWLASVHAGMRGVCTLLERLTSGAAVDAAERQAAVAFVRDVLPMHLRDEEEDLFPLLRRRCTSEDEIELVLGMLGAEHDQEAERIARVADILGHETLTARFQRVLIAFAREQHQHVAIEDGVILPIARMRLSHRDLAALRARMVARRAAFPIAGFRA